MWLTQIWLLYTIFVLTDASILGKFVKNNLRIKSFNSTEERPQSIRVHPDYGLDIYGFLNKYDYPVESHNVTTEDGYLLTLQRIPYGRYGQRSSNLKTRPAVLLQHGLGSSGVDFINRGPNASLGLMLADAGWDVWLGNNRGTVWSTRHIRLDPKKHKEFWNFSFHECGYYDLPAMIDYIISKTNQKQIFYVGHSQGTSQFFAMAASKPSYNEKIAHMSALAPVAYTKHMKSPIFKLLANTIDITAPLLDLFGITHVSRSEELAEFAKKFCSDGAKYQILCATFVFILGGFNIKQMDMSFIPVLAYNAPSGISMKMAVHYGQEVNSGYFRKFDYGSMGNLRKYKMKHPPSYNISAITAPIALYYSNNDLLANTEDVERLAVQLSNVTKNHLMEDKFFTHLDFIWAKDIKVLLNDMVIEHMTSYVDNGANIEKSIGLFAFIFSFIIIFVR